jgi:surface protein
MTDLEKVDGEERLLTHEVTDMSYMFYGCEKLATLDCSTWDVSAVVANEAMFEGCTSLTVLPEWYQQN